MKQTTRKLKIYYGYHGPPYKRYPVIHLAGYYLSHSGFNVGDEIEVVLEENKIVISRIAKAPVKTPE